MADTTTKEKKYSSTIRYGSKVINTIPVSLNLVDEPYFKNSILSTPNSVIEYDILVWNENDILLFEKKGKTNREKLEENLYFNVELDAETYIHLDLTVVINGKRFPFMTLSPSNNLIGKIQHITGTDINIMSTPIFSVSSILINELSFVTKTDGTLTIFDENNSEILLDSTQEAKAQVQHQTKELREEGHWDIFLYMISQDDINTFTKNSVGKIDVDLLSEIDNIYGIDLSAKIALKKVELEKKQTLGSIYKTQHETTILDNMANETLYVNLMNLLKSYEVSGLENLSDYRLKVYENLKLAVDNLIKLKGRLENI